jgi:hypothetical protein
MVKTSPASLPIAYRLYLPKDWADDAELATSPQDQELP